MGFIQAVMFVLRMDSLFALARKHRDTTKIVILLPNLH